MIAAVFVVIIILVRFYLPGPWPWRHSAPAPPTVPGQGSFYLGVASSGGDLPAYDRAADVTQPAILSGYTNGRNGSVADVLSYVRNLPGTVPLVSWGVDLTGNEVADGSQDAYLTAQAKAVAAYRKPVFMRLDWEMNGSWYPNWSTSTVTPSEYIAAWRHVWTIFRQQGATNAAFVWCPNIGDLGGVPWTHWYPGNQYVDWIAVDAYLDPDDATADVSGPGGLDDLATFAASSHKPAMLAEWAPGQPGNDPAQTFDFVFSWADKYPGTVKALVYFNYGSEQRDDLLPDDPQGASRYRELIQLHKNDLFGAGGVG